MTVQNRSLNRGHRLAKILRRRAEKEKTKMGRELLLKAASHIECEEIFRSTLRWCSQGCK